MNHTESGQQDQLVPRDVELSAHNPGECDKLESRTRRTRSPAPSARRLISM